MPILSRVLVFSATYNEVENVEPLITGIVEALPDADILIIDDNSPDGTAAALKGLQAKFPCLTLLIRPGKQGLGSAHRDAMGYAIENGYDVLLTMDADLSHDPASLPALLALLERADFVIGSRYAPGGSCDYSGIRLAVSRSANLLVRMLLGVDLMETTTSLRGFRRSLLNKMDFERIESDGYSFFFETVWRVSRQGATMREVPIHFASRRAGQSKISPSEVGLAVLKLVRLWVERVTR